MQAAFDAFKASMERVRALHGLHASLSKQLTAAVDLTDILRAEVVMAVSAFDFFVHELTRLGMLACFNGQRTPTDAYSRWPLPVGSLAALQNPATAAATFDTIIRERHGFLSFQQPEKVADAIRLISDVRLWEEIAVECGETVQGAKTSFKLIIERRNQIAHEADLDPTYVGTAQRWPIDRPMVDDILDRLERVAVAIFKVAV